MKKAVLVVVGVLFGLFVLGSVVGETPTVTTTTVAAVSTTTTTESVTTTVGVTTTTAVPVDLDDVQPAYCLGLLDRNWLDDDVVDQFNTCINEAVPITVIGPDALLVAYCSGRHEDSVYVSECITNETFDYRPVLSDRLERFHTDPTLLYPAEG